MIAKIISGGQTGVDRAALDVAIHLGIPHGGWVPKGRITEDGPLPETYALRETPTAVYAERTEKNVVDSDGTLIISRGGLTGGSEYTREMALKHGRPWLHVDLNRTAAFHSALAIVEWLVGYNIRVLNVAGPRASKDPGIYRDTKGLLESVYYLSLSAKDPKNNSDVRPLSPKSSPGEDLPKRVRDVVERLLGDLPLKDRVLIANMSESELPTLGPTLGEYIVNRYGLATGNSTLVRSCRWVGRRPLKNESEAAGVIIRALWKQLRRSHPLRRVK
ncbi:MAG: YpsA SLOG family protein [Hyphomicrobiales bacterium]